MFASKLLKKAFLIPGLFLALIGNSQAQSYTQTPQISGTGAPSAACLSIVAGAQYVQTDSTNGRIWVCDNSSGSYAWDHLLSPVQGIATTTTITGGGVLLSGCFPSSPVTVTVAGAVVGTNTATASPIYASAPAGNQGLFNCTAWVSAANTVSAQCCAIGTISTVPNFTLKVLVF